jgi:hypothetical protein
MSTIVGFMGGRCEPVAGRFGAISSGYPESAGGLETGDRDRDRPRTRKPGGEEFFGGGEHLGARATQRVIV